MARIDESMTLAEVAALPGFEQVGDYLFACAPEGRDAAYRQRVRDVRAAQGDAMADAMLAGLVRLDEALAGDVAVVHDVWTSEEKAADPARKHTKLLFLPGDPAMPFVLVIPGGGYNVVCTCLEGLPAAAALNEAGYNAFVLSYRRGEAARMPGPVEDVARAVGYVLEHADDLQVAPSYALMGFSAGAHLAGVFGSARRGWMRYGTDEPQALVLCYPVIDLRTVAQEGSHEFVRQMLDAALGAERAPADLAAWSINEIADGTYPPTYAWACEDDDVVPVANVGLLDARLEELGVEHQVVTYPLGGHGLTKPHDEVVDAWMDDVVAFLQAWL